MTEGTWVLLASGVLFTGVLVIGLATRTIFLMAFGKLDRDDRPVAYWTTAALIAFVALVCWYGALGGLAASS